ncbi:hypothetical protein NE237_003306 [Protea cynaroides]|uniref:Uncharacterized protein n=1 Tax=Protea cynaroides TaxID=273540 RepID=A0A9Q0KGR0_9MAGN|nr:hypothetical protein NE237_003306 [Protea cynaroides]
MIQLIIYTIFVHFENKKISHFQRLDLPNYRPHCILLEQVGGSGAQSFQCGNLCSLLMFNIIKTFNSNPVTSEMPESHLLDVSKTSFPRCYQSLIVSLHHHTP